MSGYRDTSNFDPNANPHYGKPLRPFNWVQWTGVGIGIVGLAVYAVYFAGRAGWIAANMDSLMPGFALVILGAVLVNSRRETVHDPAPELAPERRRLVLIVTLVCVVVFGLAIAIEFVRS